MIFLKDVPDGQFRVCYWKSELKLKKIDNRSRLDVNRLTENLFENLAIKKG